MKRVYNLQKWLKFTRALWIGLHVTVDSTCTIISDNSCNTYVRMFVGKLRQYLLSFYQFARNWGFGGRGEGEWEGWMVLMQVYIEFWPFLLSLIDIFFLLNLQGNCGWCCDTLWGREGYWYYGNASVPYFIIDWFFSPNLRLALGGGGGVLTWG